VGKPIEDDDLISFIVSGLNPSFNSFITTFSFATRETSLNFEDFQELLLNHEMLLNQQHNTTLDASAIALYTHKPANRPFSPKPKSFHNMRHQHQQHHAMRFPQQQHHSRFSPHSNTFASPKGSAADVSTPWGKPNQFTPNSNFNNGSRAPCQICGRTSHQALDCFHIMNYSFQGRHPPTHLTAMVAQSNAVGEDQQWIADSGANTHITNELENLTLQQPFPSDEIVAVGNGAGLAIENSGSSILISSNSKFHLKNVLYCPQATTNLLSI
jgi:hypothetical protein